MSYHLSLSSPSHPQPICRPSSNPFSIIRKTIEELIQAPAACSPLQSSMPEPVFLGLEERRKEKLEKEQASTEIGVDVLEIDLDEDGPLREEYLPKRRVSAAGSIRQSISLDSNASKGVQPILSCQKAVGAEIASRKVLPPPAKWSPAGDEPLLRGRNPVGGQYLAVQPPTITAAPVAPRSYTQSSRVPPRHWSSVGFAPLKQAPTSYGYGASYAQPSFHPYPYLLPIPISHARSQSLCYDQDDLQTRNHLRSHSQSRFEFRCSDIRMTANESRPLIQPDPQWQATDLQYGYTSHGYLFGQPPSLSYQSAWLRT
jgi:hypothetical protein